MAKRLDIIQGLSDCWDSILELCRDLDDAQWATRSLCPDWTVHGVVSHLTSVERSLIGWVPDTIDTPLPFHLVPGFMAEAASLSGAELTELLTEVTDDRRIDLAAMTDDVSDLASPTPVGPHTYGRFMAIRLFDFWVHERDIRVPLGLAGDDGGLMAELALNEVRLSMGYIVGKLAAAPDGSSVTVRLTGPVKTDLHVAVDGRAAVVDSLDNPTATVTTDSLTFMLAACGRIDPQVPISDGRITWSGDGELGERVARNLRFTM